MQDDGFGTQDTISGFEGVSGTGLGDTLLGNVLGNKLSGLLGNDRLDGRGGNDQLIGGEGNDTLIGGTGNDTIMGGMGRDWMDGGEGIDLLVFSTDPAENSYAVNVNLAGANWMVNGDGYGEQEYARGFEQASGTRLNDTLHGSSLGDTLWGNAGNDNLRGWFGDDVLWGGEGNDLIIGGEGRDTLRGGLGIDTVQGGGGVDIFVFSGDARDIVQDFAPGFDRLWIWKAAPDMVLNGPLGAAQFASGAGLRAATTAEQRVLYDTATGDLLMDVDGQGGAAALAFANLATIPAISAADFWIV